MNPNETSCSFASTSHSLVDDGVYCSSRPMRVGVATPQKRLMAIQQQYSSQAVVLAGSGFSNGSVARVPNLKGILTMQLHLLEGLILKSITRISDNR